MKKIILINPSTPDFEQSLFPPLSLAVVATAIPDSYEVKIIDENLQSIEYEADLAAISANSYSIRRAYQLARELRKRGIPVVMGGNHPTILPEEASLYADSIVIGDAENAWPDILKDFEGKRLRQFYNPEKYNFGSDILPRRNLLGNLYRFDSIETTRGCPFNCSFCSVTRFHGSTYRLKPLGLVESELKELKKRNIFIVDDNLIGSGRNAESRAIELFGLLKDANVHWMGQASLNIADSERVLELAKNSGCLFLFIGFESLNPAVMKALNKSSAGRNSEYLDIVKKIHSYGIGVMGSFIIGTDYDSIESIDQTLKFIHEADIDIPNITHLTPYPGTKVYEEIEKQNRLFDKQFWLEDPFPVFTYQPSKIKVSELKNLTKEMLASFTGFFPAIRRYFYSLKNTRSLRIASFSLAATLRACRILSKNLERQPK